MAKKDIISRLRERYRQDSSVADEGSVLMSGITQRDVERLQAFVVKHELHTGIGVTDFNKGKLRNIVFLGPTADDRAKFWAAVEKEPDILPSPFTYDEARLSHIGELLSRDTNYNIFEQVSTCIDGIWLRSFGMPPLESDCLIGQARIV